MEQLETNRISSRATHNANAVVVAVSEAEAVAVAETDDRRTTFANALK